MNSTEHFTDVIAWQKAYKIAVAIYRATEKFPQSEIYGLTSQVRRAAVSVASNIAEGFGRTSVKEKTQFYSVARGSLMELQNQLLIAKGIGYLNNKTYNQLELLCIEAVKVLSGLQKANNTKGKRV